jgi:hypothetical protein
MTRGLEESGLTLAIGDGLHVLSNEIISQSLRITGFLSCAMLYFTGTSNYHAGSPDISAT